jgi:hypothetical protein
MNLADYPLNVGVPGHRAGVHDAEGFRQGFPEAELRLAFPGQPDAAGKSGFFAASV